MLPWQLPALGPSLRLRRDQNLRRHFVMTVAMKTTFVENVDIRILASLHSDISHQVGAFYANKSLILMILAY